MVLYKEEILTLENPKLSQLLRDGFEFGYQLLIHFIIQTYFSVILGANFYFTVYLDQIFHNKINAKLSFNIETSNNKIS